MLITKIILCAVFQLVIIGMSYDIGRKYAKKNIMDKLARINQLVDEFANERRDMYSNRDGGNRTEGMDKSVGGSASK